jgi:sugar (pentulose or hexulose) kinase
MSHVAVIDIGKTNAKLALVDRETLSEIAVVTRPNTVLPGPPWPHFDVDGHWTFLLNALSDFHVEHGIDAISITTHGASLALLGADGVLAAPVLDYEHTGPDQLSAEYDNIRPPFAETGSPRLGMGLNAGAQLFWQFRSDPGLLARTDRILTYPQYWACRLTGVAATEVTSLGCHTDLWNPYRREFSSLTGRLGIADKLAPVRLAGDVLGPILPGIARLTGLARDTPVYCGIHDSNASLLPHLLSRTAPYSVVSSGTWVIAMAIGGRKVELDAALDTLVNVNALGNPVRSARFMGGREYDLAMGGPCPEPTEDDVRLVLEGRAMVLPAVVSATGPFSGRKASWLNEPPAGTGERAAAVGFYLALVTARCLELVGHEGPVVLEGPFAKNECYRRMLAVATGSDVLVTGGTTGTSQGAALLGVHSLPTGAIHTVAKATGSNATTEWTDYLMEWKGRVFSASPE